MAVARQYSGIEKRHGAGDIDRRRDHKPPTLVGNRRDDMQKTYFQQLLVQCHGKIAGPGGAADIAKMHHNTLRSRLEKLGLL